MGDENRLRGDENKPRGGAADEVPEGRVQAVLQALEQNNMQAFYVPAKEDVIPLVDGFLPPGATVSLGGSESLFECGIVVWLAAQAAAGRCTFLNRYAPGLAEEDIRDIYRRTAGADLYFCSSNAVTEAGELYNVDGNANRTAAIAYGPQAVVLVVGANKIVPDLDAAVARVKTLVAPEICRRRGRDTYCRHTGVCVAPQGGAARMAEGCDSPQRICCSYLVCGRQRVKGRIKVVLVGEALGI